MSSKLFLFDIFKEYILSGVIDLDTDTLKVALVTSSQTSAYDAWAADTAYTVGDIVVPTVDNGHRYICAVAGDSHADTEPTWPTTDETQVTDNEVTWEEYGGALADELIWGDASGNEVANGDGYTTNGETLGSSTIDYDGKVSNWDAADVTWTSLTKIFRYAFLYKSGTVGAIVNPLIGYILLDTAPDDINIAGIDFSIRWNTSGLFTLT